MRFFTPIDRRRNWSRMARRAKRDGWQIGDAQRKGTVTDDDEVERFLEEARTKVRNDAGMRITFVKREAKNATKEHEESRDREEAAKKQARARASEAAKETASAKRKLDSHLRKVGDQKSVRTHWYFALLAFFALAEYPTVVSFLNTVAGLEEVTRTIFAVVLSAVIAAVAHFISHTAHNVLSEGPRHKRDEIEDWGLAGLAGALLLGVIAFTVVFSQLRGGAFEEAARLSGDTFTDPGPTNTLFLIVQLLLFGMALLLGYSHARGDQRRELEKELRSKHRIQQAHANEADRAEQQIAEEQASIANINDQRDHEVEREEHNKKGCIGVLENAYRDSLFGGPPILWRLTRWFAG